MSRHDPARPRAMGDHPGFSKLEYAAIELTSVLIFSNRSHPNDAPSKGLELANKLFDRMENKNAP